MDHVKKMSCIKSTEYSIQTRRCFITGEYCSQQANIQKERHKLHNKPSGPEINAFVIMNFSSMSDIMYASRIKPFIEGLKKYLFLNTNNHKIACYSDPSNQDVDEEFKAVTKIHVHRADSNPVSSNIICNRICQQIQIADLIVVDVSVESANVFYEFGLATAFNKLILPICFSESFYEMKLPDKLENAIKTKQGQQLSGKRRQDIESPSYGNEADPPLKLLEKHIDCYPWRRKLFEHFGIRHQKFINDLKSDYPGVRYMSPTIVFSEKYGFSDYQYNHFPYDAPVDKNKKQEGISNPSVGKKIYDWLQASYNQPQSYCYNTLVLYTMDRILNRNQAGQCIVNFYLNITKPMMDKHCFCGDRIAILGQPNIIWDDPKDNKTDKELFYGVSDIIQIGMDEATFKAERRRIKTSDYMFSADETKYSKGCDNFKGTIDQLIKTHIRIRSIPVNPETPLYVIQFQNGIQQNLEKDVVKRIAKKNKASTDERYFFCLYHMMLDTLRFTNEIVVDLSSNSIQAMFWLGAAHGSNIQAITVRHEMSEKEKTWSGIREVSIDRPVFDISGLWTAILRYNETETFYKQLALIQQGIEQHSKLMLSETELEMLEENIFKQIYAPTQLNKNIEPAETSCNTDDTSSDRVTSIDDPYKKLLKDKNNAERQALESYYRDCFWRHMLRDNQLHLFLPMSDAHDAIGPRLQVIKWDVDAVAELSNYLSKRKVIGKYQFDTLRPYEYYGKDDKTGETSAQQENFISIGEQTRPLYDNEKAVSLAEKINQVKTLSGKVGYLHKWVKIYDDGSINRYPVQYRGFCVNTAEPEYGVNLRFYTPECTACPEREKCSSETHQTLISKTHDYCLPSEIELTLNQSPAENGQIRFAVKTMPATNVLNKFFLRFENLPNTKTVATVYCMPFSSLGDRTEESALFPQDSNLIELNKALSTLLSSEIILKHDPAMSSGLKGYYSVECKDNRHQWFLPSVLSKFELRMNGDGTAVLSVINSNVQQNSVETVFSASRDVTPPVSKELLFTIPGQLLLWREKQKRTHKNDREFKYHVSLVGASGPATKALTALLVDTEQKNRILNCDTTIDNQDIPLLKLQSHIRNLFFDKLEKKLKTVLKDSHYTTPIIYLTMCYLSTMLYQYFLPFLSHADEKRIYNSLEAFLLTIDSKDDGILKNQIKLHTSKVLDTVKQLLESFYGVEAFYAINVVATNNSGNTDSRRITGIEEFNDNEVVISCLFDESVNPPQKTNILSNLINRFLGSF